MMQGARDTTQPPEDAMALTDNELAERQHYLGGTDMAALAGVSRWGTPASVWADKRPDLAGARPIREPSAMMALGSLLEQVVADLAADATGITWSHPRQHQSPWTPWMPYDGGLPTVVPAKATDVPYRTRTIQCREHPWEGANVDRLSPIDDYLTAVLECKWGEARRRWGDAGDTTREWWDRDPVKPPIVPEEYYIQVQHYLHVTRRHDAFMAVLLGYADFRYYRIAAEPDLQASLVDLGAAFWRDHKEAGVEPSPDGSADAEARLRRRWPADDGQQRPATVAEAQALQSLRAATAAVAASQKEQARLQQVIMDSMGTTTRIDMPGASVSWKANKPTVTTVTHWADALEEITALVAPSRQHQVGGIVAAHTATTSKEGARPFRVTFSDDEEE